MKSSKRKLAASAVALVVAVLLSSALTWSARKTSEKNASSPRKRTFIFTYDVHVPPSPEMQGPVRLWIPLPQSDDHQMIRNLSLTGPVAYTKGADIEYKNSFAMLVPTSAQVASGYDANLQFEVTRLEYAKDVNTSAAKPVVLRAGEPDSTLERYLQPDKLIPLNGTIAELAREKTEGATDPLEKARRIYIYVATTMRYDKSGEGWGRGDAIWACDSKRGNCTDFHSVLIGMMRSSGIPARFEIGFPLPEGKREGDIPGYHCWAEFYVGGIGWVPVDASEASKNPAKRDYFFGAVDPDRVMFTYGRDIRLAPDHKGDPLNYFIYPYAEAKGQPVKNVKTHFAFRDVSSPNASTTGGH